MNAHGVYLDTSSVVKRYVEETGSRLTDFIYRKAEGRVHHIVISLWNVGEVIGVLDRYHERKLLDEDAVMKALKNFLGESEKMMRLGSLRILPLGVDILTETYALVLRHHIYQADALQIATCKISGSTALLSADKKLLEVARAEGLEALDIETDEEQITNRFH
jgi:predicted nucleic acid-binding protein